MNVSHVIAAGANIALYNEIKNSFVLCLKCEDIWTNRDRTTMRIYPKSQQIRQELNLKYYTKESPTQ